MSFDVKGAFAAGFSEADVVKYLSEKTGFDLAGAQAEGFEDSAILDYVLNKVNRPSTPSFTSQPTQSTQPANVDDVLSSILQADPSITPPTATADSGFLRQTADIPVQFLKGTTTGLKYITDAFGADNTLSRSLSGAEDFFDDLLSAQAKQDQQEISRIMQEAEDKGMKEQILAGIEAFTTAPVDLISNAFGTSVPTLAAGLATTLSGGTLPAAAAVATGVGTLTGLGITKDATYDAVFQELTNSGVSEAEAKSAAQEAQEYGGENIDNILLGGALGALAARFGLERAVFTANIGKKLAGEVTEEGLGKLLEKGVIPTATRTALEEAIPEALQGGQEQFTRNIALQRQGFDVPSFRGVTGGATLEGIVGTPIGALAGVREASIYNQDTAALRNLLADDVDTAVKKDTTEEIEIIDPNQLSDEETSALLKEFGDTENRELVDNLERLTPEEQADLDAGREVTRKNYVRVGKYFVPQDIGNIGSLTEKDLSERIERQLDARNKMNALGRGMSNSIDLVNELENIEAIQDADAKRKALQDRNLTGEQLVAELKAAREKAASFNEFAMQITGSETLDASYKNAQKAALEAEQESYAEAERNIRRFNTDNAAKIQRLLDTKAEDLTRQERAVRRYFSKKGIPKDGREVALLSIAADVAEGDATVDEIKQSREQQPNIPSDELIDDAFNDFIGEKRQGRLAPTKQKDAVLARQWIEDNLQGTPATQLNEALDAFKTGRKESILGLARARRRSKKTTETQARTNVIREGTPTGEVISAEVSPATPADRVANREAKKEIETLVLEKMGIKNKPRTKARLAEYNKLFAEEEGKRFESLTSEDIAAQVKRQGITFPQDIPNEVREVAERGNLNQTIEQLLKDEPKEIRVLLKNMRKMAANTKIRIAPLPESPRGGMFDEGANEIVLDPERGLNKKVFFHELAHAALSRRLDNPDSKEAKVFFKFFSQIQLQMSGFYGGKDLHEFVSEFMGNENFRALLKDLKAPRSDSFYKRVIDAILEFFGIRERQTAYDKGFEFIEEIVNLGAESEAPPMERVFFSNVTPDVVGEEAAKLPPLNKTKINKMTEAVSESRPLTRAIFKALRMDNFVELYGKYIPGLKFITDAVEQKQGYQENKIEESQEVYKGLVAFARRFQKQSEQLGDLANQIRLDEVDILDPNFITKYIDQVKKRSKDNKPPSQADVEAKKEAIKKHKETLQRLNKQTNGLASKVYKKLRTEYDGMFKEYKEFVLGTIKNKDLRDKVEQDFIANEPVAGYVPFRRFGEFILQYMDADGNYTVEAFESYSDRRRAIQRLGLKKSVEEGSELTKENPLNQYIVTNSVQNTSYKPIAGTEHFLAKVYQNMDKNLTDELRAQNKTQEEIKEAIKDLDTQKQAMYETYLDMFPENSLVKGFRKARNVPGMSNDLARAYGETSVRFARKMANTKYNGELLNAFDRVRAETANYERRYGDKANVPDPLTIQALGNEIDSRENFTVNPQYSTPIRLASTGSFTLFLAGNISSALINLTSIPLLGQPLLNRDFGGREVAALSKAMGLAISNKWQTSKDYSGLYKKLMDHAQLRHTMNREIQEGTQQSTEEFNTLTMKVMNILSIPFSETEKYNRATIGIAAYNLAKQNPDRLPEQYRGEEGALEYALKVVKDVNTSGMAATGPRLMQGDFAGGLGRATFTFKSFIWQSAYVTARAFYQSVKGETPAVKLAAFRQLMFIYGMSFGVAGVFGMPFFGAAATMANMIMAMEGALDDEEEEPFNLRRAVMDMYPEWVTKGPTNYLSNIEFSNRASVANGLLFREDPYEIEKFGYVGAAMMQAFGPLGNFARNVPYGFDLMARGEIARGVEQFSPSFLRNAFKTYRYMDEGVVTSDGLPIMEDLDGFLLAKQFLGFSPANLSSIYETRGLVKDYESKVMNRRQALLKARYDALVAQDYAEVNEIDRRIRQFANMYPRLINPRTLESSFKSRASALREYQYGLRFDRNFLPYGQKYFDRLEPSL